jgi:glyceraldehyde-3-phosphate dehydrogenase/erythrose-4-phosphate dehydrogenase
MRVGINGFGRMGRLALRDARSGVVDAISTRVTDRRLVKVMAWYDNEWGYANRLVELAALVAASAPTPATTRAGAARA